MTAMNRKYKDETWDFVKADTKEYTHCFHNYPAMMIPQIARELLNRYGTRNGWVLDPYCGTGTSLVEASMFGMNGVGCDINPLVRLIATVKTTPISLDALERCSQDLMDAVFQVGFSDDVPSAPIPDVLNLDYWFSEDVTRRLSFLRDRINAVEDESVRNFFWVAFSETVRECSYTRNSEFKLYRMPAQKLATFQPDVFGTFQGKLTRNRAGLEAYLGERKDVEISVSSRNTANRELPETRPPKGFDLILTSPPYGDSQTTVAYGQFSRLSADWIGLEGSRKVDRISMGGSTKKSGLSDSPVDSAIAEIRAVDKKRASQVEAFYIDLERSIGSVAPSARKGFDDLLCRGESQGEGCDPPDGCVYYFCFRQARIFAYGDHR